MADGEINLVEAYPMSLPRLGHAVIVNNVSGEHQGSMRDVEAMEAAYRKVGFEVQVHTDCSALDMVKVNEWIMEKDNHKDCNCFAMTIICHGNEKGHLMDKNKKTAWHTETFIEELSDVKTLIGKPKIITIQACRGTQWTSKNDTPVGALAVTNTETALPHKTDMFVTFATVPGAFVGDKKTGSIYLQSYAKYLQEQYRNLALDRILMLVRQEMVKQTHGASKMSICSEERNTLRHIVMFEEFHKLKVTSRNDCPYPMDLPRMGHAVIVNNISGEHQWSVRDMEAMEAAYKKVGFNVQVHKDCDAKEMRKVKKWIMAEENHKDCNCFAMTIICHGNKKGHLMDKDKKKAWDTETFIAELSDVETLIGKPKIITFQACRGFLRNEGKAGAAGALGDDDREATNILPDEADMFVTFATVHGCTVYVGDDPGSIYLQSYAKYLQQEYMRRPLDKILKMVHQEMVRQRHGVSGMRICSEERNSLIYDVMFSEFHKLKVTSGNQKTTPAVTGGGPSPVHPKSTPQMTGSAGHDTTKTSSHPPGSRRGEVVESPNVKPSKLKLTTQQSKQDRESFSLKLLGTHDTPMCNWGWDRMSAGPAPDTVVLYGKKSEEARAEFLFCNVSGNMVRIDKTLKPLCEHEDFIYMLPVTVEGKQLLAVACWDCHTIRLWDIQSGKVTVAFHDKRCYPGRMCHGKSGVIYCVNGVKGNSRILVLDCTKPQFSLKHTIPVSLTGHYGSTYDPVNHIVAISTSTDKLVQGYSCSSGEVVWTRKFTGEYVKPFGLVYSEKHRVIIVCAVTQIVLLNPSDGEVVQLVKPENENHDIFEACICNDTLVVRLVDIATQTFKLSFYSMR